MAVDKNVNSVNDAVRWSIMHIFMFWMYYILNYALKYNTSARYHITIVAVFIETLHAQSLL